MRTWRKTNYRCLNCGNKDVYTDDSEDGVCLCVICRCGFVGSFVEIEGDLKQSLSTLCKHLERKRNDEKKS